MNRNMESLLKTKQTVLKNRQGDVRVAEHLTLDQKDGRQTMTTRRDRFEANSAEGVIRRSGFFMMMFLGSSI